MRKHMMMVLLLVAAVLTALTAQAVGENQNRVDSVQTQAKPKYVFMFIGDGMSHVQINAAQILKGSSEKGNLSLKPLTFTEFPGHQLSRTVLHFGLSGPDLLPIATAKVHRVAGDSKSCLAFRTDREEGEVVFL